MFTGIVTTLGTLKGVEGGSFTFTASANFVRTLDSGDSVAVDGVCLTVIDFPTEKSFKVDLSSETLRRTALGQLRSGDFVNLESSLAVDSFSSGRLDGHIVQGHVDDTAKITSITSTSGDYLFRFSANGGSSSYLVEKGSISVSGISLTPIQVSGSTFAASVIPYTFDHTTLQYKRTGDLVNLEYDILAKYVQESAVYR